MLDFDSHLNCPVSWDLAVCLWEMLVIDIQPLAGPGTMVFSTVYFHSVWKHCSSVTCCLSAILELAVAYSCSWDWMRPIAVTSSLAGNGVGWSVNYHSIAGGTECPDRSWGWSVAFIFPAGSSSFTERAVQLQPSKWHSSAASHVTAQGHLPLQGYLWLRSHLFFVCWIARALQQRNFS